MSKVGTSNLGDQFEESSPNSSGVVVYNLYNVPVSDGTIVVIFARCLLSKENVGGKVQVVV